MIAPHGRVFPAVRAIAYMGVINVVAEASKRGFVNGSVRFADRRLQSEILTRLEKPHRLERLEAAFHPLDVNAVRSALFDLLAAGKVIAPEIDSAQLSLSTVFRRPPP